MSDSINDLKNAIKKCEELDKIEFAIRSLEDMKKDNEIKMKRLRDCMLELELQEYSINNTINIAKMRKIIISDD